MYMKYLKLVKSEMISAGTKEASLVDTHGLMARLRVVSGELYIAGEEDVAVTSCAVLSAGQEISFVGAARLLAKGSAAELSVLYFDKV